MVQEICLDSDILIEISKNNLQLKKELENIEGNFSTTSVNLFEILSGERDNENLDALIEDLNKLNFDESSARAASKIFKSLKKKGNLIDARDIFIGAICIANNSTLFTHNKKHFDRLKEFGLKLR